MRATSGVPGTGAGEWRRVRRVAQAASGLTKQESREEAIERGRKESLKKLVPLESHHAGGVTGVKGVGGRRPASKSRCEFNEEINEEQAWQNQDVLGIVSGALNIFCAMKPLSSQLNPDSIRFVTALGPV